MPRPWVADLLAGAEPDLLAHFTFPETRRRQVWLATSREARQPIALLRGPVWWTHATRRRHGYDATMAKNTGSGFRKGAVKTRSQTQAPSGHYVKRDALSGRFLDVKKDQSPFKGVRKEK